MEILLRSEDMKTVSYTVDPLFLHFCLWFVFGDQKYLPLPKKEVALDSIFSGVLEQLDVTQLDLQVVEELFPALCLRDTNDSLILDFMSKVLERLRNTKDVVLQDSHTTKLILSSIISGGNIFHQSR